MTILGRYRGCQVLQANNVPCVVWFEDAIELHHVPTVLVDLYLVVEDIEAAANVLQEHGWTGDRSDTVKVRGIEVKSPEYCFTVPPASSMNSRRASRDGRSGAATPMSAPLARHLHLIPASEWGFDFEKQLEAHPANAPGSIFPPVSSVLDAMLHTLLDGPDDKTAVARIYASELYNHVDRLKQASYASHLIFENRQAHLDMCAGMTFGTPQYVSHERRIRDELRAGARELSECSTRDDKSLFEPTTYTPPPPCLGRASFIDLNAFTPL